MSIDRIEKLIALAGSANENEARSAAVLACKLIREGGYRVVDPRAAQASHGMHEAQGVDAWDDLFAAFSSAAQQARRPPRRPAEPPPDTRPRRRVPCEIARARRSGSCAVCGEHYEEGSDVAVPILASDSKLGAVHADCRSRWTVIDES